MASKSNSPRVFVTYPPKKLNSANLLGKDNPGEDSPNKRESDSGNPQSLSKSNTPHTRETKSADQVGNQSSPSKSGVMSSVNNSRGSPQPQQRTPLQSNSSVGTSKNGETGRSVTGANQNSNSGQGNRPAVALRPKPAATQPPGPAGTNVPNKGTPGTTTNVPPGKRVVMRLRCKYRPLHDSYFQDGTIVDQDTDVVFICGDGGRVKGHRIILASTSKFFSAVFSEQRSEEVSYVSVPWIRSDVMKLVLMMAYKEKVILTADQMESLKNSAEQLGISTGGLQEESVDPDVKLDVRPGKIMDSLPKSVNPSLPTLVARPPGGHVTYSPQRRPVAAAPAVSPQRRVFPPNTNVQDPESEDSEEESDEYQFQLQGYDQQRRQLTANQRQPRVETERDEMDEYDVQTDPIQAQNMIKEWMAKVGQEDVHKPHRMNMNAPDQKKFECTVCNASFVKAKSWKWHEERHVGLGLFKCTQCDELLKTSRAVWTHEQNAHNFSEISIQELEEPRAIPSNFQVVENRRHFMGQGALNARLASNKPQMQQQYNSSNTIRLAQLKRLKTPTKFSQGRSGGEQFMMPSRSSYAIGNSRGSEHLDTRKVKQLHWLYVCAKCDNCSDSSQKAMIHYSKCYPMEEVAFESTVTKYRQGFYGKSQCPLCPRRYTANGGFMIHCGHQHPQYRKLFSHTGAVEDKLKCSSCGRKFSFPDDFHEHLENGIECTKSPINEESMPLLVGGRGAGGNSMGGMGFKTKRKPVVSARSSPAGTDEAGTPGKSQTPKVTPVKAAPTPPVPAAQPRSARLAQRASMILAKQIAKAEQDEDEQVAFNQRIGTTKRRASAFDYPPADCPICGASDVTNISLHLAKDHKDLKITVNRISTDLLRCRKCLITFAICDLLGHVNSCSSANEDGPAPSRTPTPDPAQTSEHIIVDVNNLPPGVGSSPIDRIENTDLFSKETLRKALVCGVCNYTAPKLGDIAACLKSHGIHRCVLCFNSYCNRGDYSTHLRKCHGQPGIGNSVGKLKCPLCNKLFQNAGQVASHMYTGHWTALLREMRESFANGEDFSKDPPNTPSQESADESKATSKPDNTETGQSVGMETDEGAPDTPEDDKPDESSNEQTENDSESTPLQNDKNDDEVMETSEEAAVDDETDGKNGTEENDETGDQSTEAKLPNEDSKTTTKAEVKDDGKPIVKHEATEQPE